jgi:hypothetical protein
VTTCAVGFIDIERHRRARNNGFGTLHQRYRTVIRQLYGWSGPQLCLKHADPTLRNQGQLVEWRFINIHLGTRAQEMLVQGQEMFTWIPNAYINAASLATTGSTTVGCRIAGD